MTANDADDRRRMRLKGIRDALYTARPEDADKVRRLQCGVELEQLDDKTILRIYHFIHNANLR